MQKAKGQINLTRRGAWLGASAGIIIGFLVQVVFVVAYVLEASASGITDGYWILIPILTCVPVLIVLGLYGAIVGAIGGHLVKKQFTRTSGKELTQADKGAWARTSWLFGAAAGLVPLLLLALVSFESILQFFQPVIPLGSGYLALLIVGLALVAFSAIAARLSYTRLLAGASSARPQRTPPENVNP